MSHTLHTAVSKRFTAALALALVAIIALSVVSQASAESIVQNQPQTNVFFRYGIGSGSNSESYTYTAEIYKHGRWTDNNSANFGSLLVSEAEGATGLKLKLVPGEKIVDIKNEYRLPNGERAHFPWSGINELPFHRSFGSSEVSLYFVDVGIHSNKLPNQPTEPKHTGMR